MIRRRLLTIASAISLLLCVAITTLWVLSYRSGYIYERETQYFEHRKSENPFVEIHNGGHVSNIVTALAVRRGKICFAWGTIKPGPSVKIQAAPWLLDVLPAGDSSRWYRSLPVYIRTSTYAGFCYSEEDHKAGPIYTTTRALTFPCWLIVIALFVFSTWSAIHRWWTSTRTADSCPSCDYNLTANVSGVCPECGTPVPSKLEGIA